MNLKLCPGWKARGEATACRNGVTPHGNAIAPLDETLRKTTFRYTVACCNAWSV
eukprot:CAMPEP_0170639802 /NCGR_PEP_ID=MMETSP0224-20130122/39857_1 /TAXON_ID=285029 /ORGANISM="Togula jolla, Strain CCCM 725" /LENGTH=53 /DNA_ID=CAMNT_0010970209 /DNA_START=60 /DNA_END=217 /DNA_ORIENTATION=-